MAAELGLHETHFVNPNGLPAPGISRVPAISPRLTHHALALPTFAKYVSTSKHGCTLLGPNGRDGTSSGPIPTACWTPRVMTASRPGRPGPPASAWWPAAAAGGDHVIVVVLGASSTEARYADARNLFRYAWLMRGKRAPRTLGFFDADAFDDQFAARKSDKGLRVKWFCGSMKAPLGCAGLRPANTNRAGTFDLALAVAVPTASRYVLL